MTIAISHHMLFFLIRVSRFGRLCLAKNPSNSSKKSSQFMKISINFVVFNIYRRGVGVKVLEPFYSLLFVLFYFICKKIELKILIIN